MRSTLIIAVVFLLLSAILTLFLIGVWTVPLREGLDESDKYVASGVYGCSALICFIGSIFSFCWFFHERKKGKPATQES